MTGDQVFRLILSALTFSTIVLMIWLAGKDW